MGRDALKDLDITIAILLREMGPPSGDESFVQGYRRAMYDLIQRLDIEGTEALYYLLNTRTKYEAF